MNLAGSIGGTGEQRRLRWRRVYRTADHLESFTQPIISIQKTDRGPRLLVQFCAFSLQSLRSSSPRLFLLVISRMFAFP
jgi:hypothetical protein